MSKKPEFNFCPCCGKKKYALLQDKVHLDWARTCVACGYQMELMPRASSRINSYHFDPIDRGDEVDTLKAGLQVAGSLEELFADLS